jgi:NADPH2:quinone reductase
MKAIMLREFGGPEKLVYEDVPCPEPGPDEVLIRVAAVSVNQGLDFPARQGTYARPVTLPHILGVDPSGVIEAVGGRVTSHQPGDRVYAGFLIGCGTCDACHAHKFYACKDNKMLGITRWGGYAEFVAVPAPNVSIVPEELSFAEATVIARHFPTAANMLQDRAQLKNGEWILVMGAAGGLGNAGVQVAKFTGARVIAGAGADARVRRALDAGADYGINYRSQDLEAEVMRITGGAGVDVLFENIADPELWPGAFNSLARYGRLVTTGAHGGGRVTLDVSRLYLRRISILGGADPVPGGVELAFNMAVEGRLDPGIDRVLPLKSAPEAHSAIAAGDVNGKVVLDPQLD